MHTDASCDIWDCKLKLVGYEILKSHGITQTGSCKNTPIWFWLVNCVQTDDKKAQYSCMQENLMKNQKPELPQLSVI